MRMRLLAVAIVFASPLCQPKSLAPKPGSRRCSRRREHDFGTVARGADTVYRFPVKNIYKQDIELVSVRSSCGCTTPTIEKKMLKTGEIGYVVATFNTRTFTGMHGATLTVEVEWNDKASAAAAKRSSASTATSAATSCSSQARSSSITSIKARQSEQNVEVTYAGRAAGKSSMSAAPATTSKSSSRRQQRYSGRVPTSCLFALKDSAAAGYFNEQLVLVTNDERNPRIPIHVAGPRRAADLRRPGAAAARRRRRMASRFRRK